MLAHSPAYAQAYQEARSWGVGGSKSRALSAAETLITGALGGQGDLQLAANTLAPYAAAAIGKRFGHGENKNEAAQAIGHFMLGAALAYANGADPLAGGSAAVAAERAAEYLAKQYDDGRTAIDPISGKFNPNLLPEHIKEEIKAQTGALASVVGAAGGSLKGGSGGTNNGANTNALFNAQVGGVLGQNAVENNAIHQANGENYERHMKELLSKKINKDVLKTEESKLHKEIQDEHLRNHQGIENNCKQGIELCKDHLRHLTNAEYYYIKRLSNHDVQASPKIKQLIEEMLHFTRVDIKMAKEYISEKNPSSIRPQFATHKVENQPVDFRGGNNGRQVWNTGEYAARLEKTPPSHADYYALHTGSVTTYMPTRDKGNIMVSLPISEDTLPLPLDSGLIKDGVRGGGNVIKQKRLPSKGELAKGVTGHLFGAPSLTGGYILSEPEKIAKEREKIKAELTRQGVYTVNPKLFYTEEMDRIWKEHTNDFLPGESTTFGGCKFGICVNGVRTITNKWAVEFGIGGSWKGAGSAGHGTTYPLKGIFHKDGGQDDK